MAIKIDYNAANMITYRITIEHKNIRKKGIDK